MAIFAGQTGKLNSRRIFEKFNGRCFKCGTALTYQERGDQNFNLDHTLPNRYLWPITTDSATLLCKACNNQKHDKWPSEVYSPAQLKALAVLTNFPYDLLSGPPSLNPEAIEAIVANVDAFLVQWIHYPQDIKRVRNLILQMEGVDIFEHARGNIPPYLYE